MNHIEKAAASTKNFVRRHKTAVTVVATSAVWYAINRTALNQHDEFLKENGLYDAFYGTLED